MTIGYDVLGWRTHRGKKKLILERHTGPDSCAACKGFGTYGNPLCGALYTCKACNGDGFIKREKTMRIKYTLIQAGIGIMSGIGIGVYMDGLLNTEPAWSIETLVVSTVVTVLSLIVLAFTLHSVRKYPEAFGG